jgi:hypothetical protein
MRLTVHETTENIRIRWCLMNMIIVIIKYFICYLTIIIIIIHTYRLILKSYIITIYSYYWLKFCLSKNRIVFLNSNKLTWIVRTCIHLLLSTIAIGFKFIRWTFMSTVRIKSLTTLEDEIGYWKFLRRRINIQIWAYSSRIYNHR